MPIILELYELKNLCAEMAELGAANYAKRIAPANDLISQREAYREFQECRVKKWVQKVQYLLLVAVLPYAPKFFIPERSYWLLINLKNLTL